MRILHSEILSNLRCDCCKLILSCGPVKILTNSRPICGRCDVDQLLNVVRTFTYEEIAKLFLFPCKYRARNCNKFLPWQSLQQHEENCAKKSAGCCCCRKSYHGRELLKYDNTEARQLIADINILNKLMCGRCRKYLNKPPLFLAPNGADICADCRSYLKDDFPLVQNRPLETILKSVRFICCYQSYGCNNQYSFGSNHEEECKYKHLFDLDYHLEEAERNNSYTKPSKNSGYDGDSSEISTQSPIPKHKQLRDVDSLSHTSHETNDERKKNKIKGVIRTGRGHIYATITPSHPDYALYNDRVNSTQNLGEEEHAHKQYKVQVANRHDGNTNEAFQHSSENLGKHYGGNVARNESFVRLHRVNENGTKTGISRNESLSYQPPMYNKLVSELKTKQQQRY